MALSIGELVGYVDLDTSSAESAASGFGGVLEKMGGQWGKILGGLGAGGALAFGAGLVSAMDAEVGSDMLAASLGGGEKLAARYGDIAGKVYSNGFGAGLEDVNTAMGAVVTSIKGMRGASDKEVQKMTEKAMTFADVMGVDVTRAAQVAGNMVYNGMAKNGTEAFDLLMKASQKVPVQLREDVLDATDEYGQFFAQLGIDGPAAMGMLAAGAEKGMYGIDKAGDAIKEFTIKATDMSTGTKDAYKLIGLGAKDMTADLLAGGDRGAKAFDKIVDGVLSIKDPVEQSQAALGLFGTPLEDLGTKDIPKFLESLRNGEDRLGKFKGAVDKAGDTAYDNAKSNLSTFGRSLKTHFVDMIGGQVLPALGDLTGGMSDTSRKVLRSLEKLTDGKIDGKKLGEQLAKAVESGLSKLGTMAGKLTARLDDTFGKVDWVGLGISVGKQVPAILLGLAAGILNFDLGSLLSGVADHWFEVLLGIITIAFAPAKLLGPLTKLLSKIPFVGRFLAAALTWVNQLGGKLTKFGGDLLRNFWKGLTNTPLPGGAFVSRIMGLLASAPGRIKSFFGTLQTRVGVWALDAFEAMGRGARTAVSRALGFVASIPGRVLNALGNLARTLSPRGVQLIEGMLTGLREKFTAVVALVKGIPGRIVSALGNLGRLLYSAGASILQGLIDGIQSKISSLTSKLSSITKLIPKNKGPESVDKKLLRRNGQLIMQGLMDGITDGTKDLKALLNRVTDDLGKGKLAKVEKALSHQYARGLRIAAQRNTVAKKLETARAALEDAIRLRDDLYASVKSSTLAFGGAAGVELGEGETLTGGAIVKHMQDRLAEVEKFRQNMATLLGQGLDKTTYLDMINQGVDGAGAMATALVQDPAAVRAVADLSGRLTTAADALAKDASTSMYQAGVTTAQSIVDGLELDEARLAIKAQGVADKIAAALRDALNVAVGSITLDGTKAAQAYVANHGDKGGKGQGRGDGKGRDSRTGPLIGQVLQQPGESADELAERLWYKTRKRG